jgi:hypothetical protein
MAAESKPLQQEQNPVPVSPAQPVVHELVAKDFILGAPEFGTPALVQNHKLFVEDYLSGSLVFSAPTMVRYRPSVGPVGGRPAKIPDDLKMKWIAAVERFVIERQPKISTTLFQTSTVVVNFAQELARAARIEVSDTVVIRQVIRPAIKSAKLKVRPKTDRN